MSEQRRGPSFWRRLPVLGAIAAEWQAWRDERRQPCYRVAQLAEGDLHLPPYPIDMAPVLALPFDELDEHGVVYNAPAGHSPGAYQPTSITQYALAQWNTYLATGAEEHRRAFLAQARWLVAHEVRLAAGDVGGWPIPFPLPEFHAPGPWLSASAQGNAVSVLVRAYRLTDEEVFLDVARRAVRTFQSDVLDGGVCAAVGDDGVFFEEVAVYPAAHALDGHVLGLLGLHDYLDLTGDADAATLIQRGLATLHTLLDEYDTGYWTRDDLMHRLLAPRFYHALHITLLEVLARYSGCERCAATAARWAGYQRRLTCRLRALLISRGARYRRALWGRARRAIFGAPAADERTAPDRVCVPITAFPVAGGMRGVLAGLARVMAGEWQLEYLTRQVGAQTEGFSIERFGRGAATYWQIPNVWLYVLAGARTLLALLRRRPPAQLILPQDAVFTGAFAALAGRMAGVRVVCMDHGTLTLLDDRRYLAERVTALKAHSLPARTLARFRFACYRPSLRLLAWIAARSSDHFLVAGDEVEEVYRLRLGVHPHRMTRYPYTVDAARYTPPSPRARADLRARHGLAEDAIVITMINRLAPEKGLDVALRGIALARSRLPDDLRARVRVLIAGEGPLAAQVAADIERYDLGACCTLEGEAAPEEVVSLLALADVFLYTGTRGTNYSMAVLEAMAAGCAVIASAEPRSNARLLAEGRGIAIPAGDAGAVGAAVAQLVADPALRHAMGLLAREYVMTHHSATALKRCLLRATGWPGMLAAPALIGAPEARVARVGSPR